MKLDLEVLHHGCMWQSSPARDADEEPVCQSVFALVQICTNVDNIVSRGQNKVVRCSLLAEGFTCPWRIRANAASGSDKADDVPMRDEN
jgi:hypothetical protein